MTNPSPDLYALIIRLIAAHNGRLRATQGHLAHAAFLDILRQVDPALSAAIHNINGRKPFTISPLEGLRPSSQRQPHHQSRARRLAARHPARSAPVPNLHQLLPARPKPAGHPAGKPAPFTSVKSSPRPAAIPSLDTTSLQTLYAQWQPPETTRPRITRLSGCFSAPPPPSACAMHPFATCTSCPIRLSFLASLPTIGTGSPGSETREPVRQFCAEAVVVARYNIETHMYQYRRSKQVGFTGKVAFEILDKDAADMTQHLNRLADLAFYTGVGSKTTRAWGKSTDFSVWMRNGELIPHSARRAPH